MAGRPPLQALEISGDRPAFKSRRFIGMASGRVSCVAASFNHHHRHSGFANFLIRKVHQRLAYTLPLMTGRHGDDVDFAHLILRMDANPNETDQFVILEGQPNILRFVLQK